MNIKDAEDRRACFAIVILAAVCTAAGFALGFAVYSAGVFVQGY